MKKTLAVIMAAAMAANVGVVAFAQDFQNNDAAFITSSSSSGKSAWIVIGKDNKYDVEVNEVELRDGNIYSFSSAQLAQMMENNQLSASVVVTSGKDKLDSMPTLKVVNDAVQLKVKFKDNWGVDVMDDSNVKAKIRVKFTAKKDITFGAETESRTVVQYKDGSETKYITKDGADYLANGGTWGESCVTTDVEDAYDYGTFNKANAAASAFNKEWKDDGYTSSVKTVKFTLNEGGTDKILKKGDTITCPEFEVKGYYYDVNDYGDTLTVTPTEVDNRYIVADGEDLYDNAGSGDKVTLYFGPTGDIASFNFKVSSAQKDLNLAYDTKEISDVVDAYPNVDFEFINFKSRTHNVLTNAATATFNAIGGKNTTVYEWDGRTLTELNSKYDSVDDTVIVEGIKRLTTYVVSEKELVAETKATETDAPVVEPEPDTETQAPAVPSAPTNNDNPSTGAL